jgi:2-polyprenyl-3-methyl-5-hydroxy-6-metoxy-1,4-benzoquinol methylase
VPPALEERCEAWYQPCMIHLGRRSYPYMEEVNEGILREFRRILPTTGRALDVGCGRGQLGQAIKELGWRVWGIEENEEARAIASQRLDRAIRSDLTHYDAVARELDDGPFDALVFSDVLEHLYDPRTVVERYLEWLAPGGRVFVSVPNAVVWTNRLRWAMGRVQYEDTGVMDRTHIRFFTFDSAKELLRACGCRVTHVSSTPYIVRAILPLLKTFSKKGEEKHDPRAIIDSPAYKAYMRLAYPIESTVSALWPTMLAFRIVVVAEFAGGA